MILPVKTDRVSSPLQFGVGPAIILALFMAATGARAQGVAILKEQPFHRDRTAKAVVYRRISTHGPYLRLATYRGNVDIKRSKLTDRIDFPDPPPPRLMEERDIAPIRNSLAAMKRFATRYPASAPLLQPEIDVVSGYVERFATGDVRFEGRWIPKDKIPELLEDRQLEAAAKRRSEVEQTVENEARKDMGLVLIDGKWETEEEALKRPAGARTQLSDTLWPLITPDLDAARKAVKNLATLAAEQTGATKVRTLRLRAVIRNLFLAEFQLTRQMLAGTVLEAQATVHDLNAKQWLEPNAFGTERKDVARKSLAKAKQLRKDAAQKLENHRAQLLGQLREADLVTEDFYTLREHRVALVLAETARAVAARHFSAGEFLPTFPDETLAAIRKEMSTRK